jgi:Plant specific mitochondrial import receptor subunit TOM20
MSFLASLTKKSKLDATVKKAAKARAAEGADADQLYREAYQDYADVMTGDGLRAATLYHWGVALLNQAKSKAAPESINIYRNAIAKFSFCMTIDPNYLAAAIDAGVACMDLARARGVPLTDELYEMAIRQFEKANSIQAGMAAYNLACIHGLRGNNDECLKMLKLSKDKGSLPDKADILHDPDMAEVVKQTWFTDFMNAIEEEKRAAQEEIEAKKAAAAAAIKAEKERKAQAYDPYRNDKPKAKPDTDAADTVTSGDAVTGEDTSASQ